jgi:hypothetical protein
MRRISLKTGLYAVFYTFTALVLCVCLVEPVDRTKFPQDEYVQIVIGQGQEKVNLKVNSEGKPGNGKITDLAKNEYYIVEEWEDGSNTIGEADNIMFVAAGGTTNSLLTGIGRLTGTEITGLTNNNTYRVTSATKRLDKNNLNYYYDDVPTATKNTQISNGTISIKPPYPPLGVNIVIGGVFDMGDLPINSTRYDFICVPVSPSGNVMSIAPAGDLQMPAVAGTSFDYVFYYKEDPGNIKLSVLTVVFEEEERGGAVITPIFKISDETPVLEYSTNGGGTWTDVPTTAEITETVNSSTSISIRVKDSTNYSSFSWYTDNTTLSSTTNTLTITRGTTPFTEGKTYILTVVVLHSDGKYYGKIVFVKVDI